MANLYTNQMEVPYGTYLWSERRRVSEQYVCVDLDPAKRDYEGRLTHIIVKEQMERGSRDTSHPGSYFVSREVSLPVRLYPGYYVGGYQE